MERHTTRCPAEIRLWVSDFTYVAIRTSFFYVAFVIDAYPRRIVGWRVNRSAHAGFVVDALEQPLHQRGLIFGDDRVYHSDRGGQYVLIKHPNAPGRPTSSILLAAWEIATIAL